MNNSNQGQDIAEAMLDATVRLNESISSLNQDNETNTPSEYPNAPDIPDDAISSNLDQILCTTEIESTTRFSTAIWYAKIREQDVNILGVGGIGSYVSFLVARMKPNSITLYDNDRVDVTNMGGQLYQRADIGEYKVNSAQKIANNFCDYYFTYGYRMLFNESDNFYGRIVICGFDNMDARKAAFKSWKRAVSASMDEAKHEFLFIDGRLAAEEFQVFCIGGSDDYHIKIYEDNWLFDDSEAEETVCSYKQTSFAANMIASVMVNLFVNFCANLCNPLIERDVPFLTRYDATTMFFKTE